MSSELTKVSESEIREIIGKHYGVRKDGVTLNQDYEFVRKGGDKVRRDFIYGIIDFNFAEQTEPKGESDEVIRWNTNRR